jgi:DNA-directed RNA polymerase subunit RPC12/RpoP
MGTEGWDGDDGDAKANKQGVFDEFDCPECHANNPWPDGFKAKDEVACHYCGSVFEARVSEAGRLKLKEL